MDVSPAVDTSPDYWRASYQWKAASLPQLLFQESAESSTLVVAFISVPGPSSTLTPSRSTTSARMAMIHLQSSTSSSTYSSAPPTSLPAACFQRMRRRDDGPTGGKGSHHTLQGKQLDQNPVRQNHLSTDVSPQETSVEEPKSRPAASAPGCLSSKPHPKPVHLQTPPSEATGRKRLKIKLRYQPARSVIPKRGAASVSRAISSGAGGAGCSSGPPSRPAASTKPSKPAGVHNRM